MSDAAARVHESRGAAAVTLASGDLEATFLLELNLLGASLRLAGEEYLAVPGGVAAYRRGHTTGLPLLAPWANRLAALTYTSGRRRVDLRGLDLHRDARGLPIHGTVSAGDSWTITSLKAVRTHASLNASFVYGSPDQLAAFPFPHRLDVAIVVDGRTLSLTTALSPTAERLVPVCFGYHPYFRLPVGRRADWTLRLPHRLRLELDERGIPTGRRDEEAAEAGRIGSESFDDLFGLVGSRTFALECRDRRLTVAYGRGYRFAQIFAPAGKRFVALEPMTAATNALVDGTCAVVRPGETYAARFRIRPERLEAAA